MNDLNLGLLWQEVLLTYLRDCGCDITDAIAAANKAVKAAKKILADA